MERPPIEKKYVSASDGQKIYYETSIVPRSSAPTVVLVHGIGGDVDGWQFVRDALLDEGLSTVALDVRGHGYSSHPRRAKDYAMDLLLKDIVHTIDAEKLDHVVLVGHSGGGVIALNFALAHQDRLSSLVLLAGSYRSPDYMRSRIAKRIADVIVTLGAFVSPPHPGPWHSTYLREKFARDYEPWGLVRTIFRNSLHSYLLVGRELANIELEDRLAEIVVPTMIVAGERDSIYPLDIPKTMREKIPGSRLEIIAGGNHVIIHNNAEETAGHIISFVRRRHPRS